MSVNKTYQLVWIAQGKHQHICEGSASFLQFKKQQLCKERQFAQGLFRIMSMDGIKYQLK